MSMVDEMMFTVQHNMNPFALSGILTAGSSLCCGLFVLFKSPNRKLGLSWFFFTLSVAVWGFGAMLYATAGGAEEALSIVKISYCFGVIWIPCLFLHFVSIFLEDRRIGDVAINYIIAFAFLLTLNSDLLFERPRWVFDSMFYPAGGKLFPIFLTWWISLVFYSHYKLYMAFKQLPEQKRDQVKYFFLATAIGFAGGITAFLPNLRLDVYPWGHFTVCLYPLIVAYAIVKHHLMDIKVIIRKTLIYSLLLIACIGGYIVFVTHFTHRGILPLANFSILTSALSTAMALFVLVKAPRNSLTSLWIAMCLSVALWCLGFGMMVKAETVLGSLFWQKWFLYGGAIIITPIYLHFVMLLIGRPLGWPLYVSYALAGVFQIVNFSGYLASVEPKPPFIFYTEAIFPFYHAYTLFFFVVAAYAHWLLFKKLQVTEGALRNQIQYVFLGTAIGFLGGSTTFPLCFNIHLFPIGAYLVVFYILAVTYAIYKHRLMDINVVLRKSLVYSLMTGILTAVYLVFITQGAHILQSLFGASTFFTSVIAACVITAGFLPLRARIQTFVDRYFFRDWSERGEVLREVAAGFSHELKSPLAGLSMQVQLMLAELDEIEQGQRPFQEAIPKMREELNYLLNKSMDAARRIEAVRGVAEPSKSQIEAVNVPDVLENSLATLQGLIAQVEPVIERNLQAGLSPVRSNSKQLEIVFINLMKNSLEAMDGPMNGRRPVLSLVGSQEGDSVLIRVKDTGPGIAERDLGRVFDPYFTTKGQRGTGMGLFLAQQIIRAYNGTLDVKSEEGKGTEFIVSLPKYSVEKAA
jgi:signal transduction histidine kinase